MNQAQEWVDNGAKMENGWSPTEGTTRHFDDESYCVFNGAEWEVARDRSYFNGTMWVSRSTPEELAVLYADKMG